MIASTLFNKTYERAMTKLFPPIKPLSGIIQLAFLALGIGLMASIILDARAQRLDRALKTAQNSTIKSAAAQQKIDTLDDERESAMLEYRALLQQIEGYRLQIEQQQVFLKSQESELSSLEQQFSRVDNIEREMIPMIKKMIIALGEFIEIDLPFKLEERMERLARLKEAQNDPNISKAELYRLILNAYEIEMSYGKGLEAWEGTNSSGEKVEFLRIGRVAYIYKNEDRKYFIWDKNSKSWNKLPSKYSLNINKTYRMAKEVAAPELILVPVNGAKSAQ